MAYRVVGGGTGKKGIANAAIQIDGLDDMITLVAGLPGGPAKNALTTGVNAGMAVISSAMRKGVNATSTLTEHEASLKTGMRKSIRKRFNKGGLDKLGKSHQTVGVVGFSVARPRGDIERLSRGETANAYHHGVAQATAHWFVLGTPNRQPTQVPDYFSQVAPDALASSGSTAAAVAVLKAEKRFTAIAAREAARRGL